MKKWNGASGSPKAIRFFTLLRKNVSRDPIPKYSPERDSLFKLLPLKYHQENQKRGGMRIAYEILDKMEDVINAPERRNSHLWLDFKARIRTQKAAINHSAETLSVFPSAIVFVMKVDVTTKRMMILIEFILIPINLQISTTDLTNSKPEDNR